MSALSLGVLAAAGSKTQPSHHTELFTISLFVLSGVLFVVLLAWVLGLRLPRHKAHADRALIDPDQAIVANAELIVGLLRSATPQQPTEGNWLAWLHESPSASATEDLERFLTVMQNVYEDALTTALPDGNTYLALARSHCLIMGLVDDFATVCTRLDKLTNEACTREQVTIISMRATILVATLLCTFGGALFAASSH
jgi:hypothetical protein